MKGVAGVIAMRQRSSPATLPSPSGDSISVAKEREILRGGSRGGARGGSVPPLFWVKKSR